jgi:hypothetical protein
MKRASSSLNLKGLLTYLLARFPLRLIRDRLTTSILGDVLSHNSKRLLLAERIEPSP